MARSAYVASSAERALRDYIGRSLEPGMQLPSERDLAEQLGASRPTVREVVSMMCRSGELVKKWGIGTFVSAQARPFLLNLNSSVVLRVDAQHQGFRASFTKPAIERIPAESETAALFGFQSGTPLWKVDRVLVLDDLPAMRIQDLVPCSFDGRTVDFEDFGSPGNEDFIPYIHGRTGLFMSESDTVMRPTLADEETARLLDIEAGSPMLSNNYVGRTAEGRILTVSHGWYVQGRVEILVHTSWGARDADNPQTRFPL